MRQRAREIWISLRPASRVAAVLGCIALALLAGFFFLRLLPEWLATDGLEDQAKAEEIGRTRTAVLAALAGLIAVTGAIFTGLSYRLNRAGQITERFTRAIDQLGGSSLDVRLGGIYALERIARDSKDDHPQVVEVLTAYVREHSRTRRESSTESAREATAAPIEAVRALERIATGAKPDAVATRSAQPAAGEDRPPELPTDIQAAMDVLARRRLSHERERLSLDLRGAGLRGLLLPPGGANLEFAWLAEADLRDAVLNEANLASTRLQGANLEGAYLIDANLRTASLDQANLQHARMGGTDLREADLAEANLQAASLERADLRNASLTGADLQGADLSGANLREALIFSTNWKGATYTSREITSILDDQIPATVWPDDFTPPEEAVDVSDEMDFSDSDA